MSHLSLLLSPRILGFRNALRDSSPGARRRTFIAALAGLLFWALMFGLSARVLLYFQSVEVIGDILAHHLLAMVLLTFFSLLVFSHIITALSNLYLSRDLELCHTTPVSIEEVFLSRFVLTVMDSSWMVVIFGLPVLMAYAYVYRPGPGYYLSLLHMGPAMVMIAGGIGILITMVMVSIFPARRTRDILMLLSIFAVVALYFLFRFLRPERLVDPDAFFSVMQYIGALKAPDSPYLPSHWVTSVLWDQLSPSAGSSALYDNLLVWSTAAAVLVVNVWVAEA
ncbi:MAG: hypothetical protein JW821_00285, partial [Deltaproteobacteria bacterium]|nr:hypothetical protein [Deltaproteobacteria bacterium]